MKVMTIHKFQFTLVEGSLCPRCPQCHVVSRVHSAKGLKEFYARHAHNK